ncbi:MAG: SpoVA/SpoVAEb family sporulation membrane protein [Hungatella sp.]|nr:SpoVA/SpoVAEb family sporulation membrane protein [Hungatella sp.]
MEMNKDAYNAYVKEITPTNPTWKNILCAFITGGAICTVGQVILNWLQSYGLDEKAAGAWNLLALILASIVLTGLNVYPKIVKWGGAGALVPITGFANSVVAPAIEYKAEGQVFGIGCKIFTIAGPVILYGILSSWVLGVIYWVGGVMGVFSN